MSRGSRVVVCQFGKQPHIEDVECQDVVELLDFVHECSEIGNAFGGYNCTCGEPWMDTLGGCLYRERP